MGSNVLFKLKPESLNRMSRELLKVAVDVVEAYDLDDLPRRSYVRTDYGEGWLVDVFPNGAYQLKDIGGRKWKVDSSDISAIWDKKKKVWVKLR
jgi:hypothetical protein